MYLTTPFSLSLIALIAHTIPDIYNKNPIITVYQLTRKSGKYIAIGANGIREKVNPNITKIKDQVLYIYLPPNSKLFFYTISISY